MIRTTLFFLLLAVLSTALVWVSSNDGFVILEWGQYEITTKVSYLILAFVLVFVIILAIYHIIAAFFNIPSSVNRKFSEHQNAKGYQLLTQGFSAVAAGDASRAKKLANQSQKLLKNSPINLLLSAQVAGLEGDEQKTKEIFADMLENKETEAIGLRGLLIEAKKNQDIEKALEYAEKIYAKSPKQEWILSILAEIYAYQKKWDKTLNIIELQSKYNFISKAEAAKRKAIVLYEKAKEKIGDEKRKLLKKAFNTYSGLVPLAVDYARVGRPEKVLGQAWKVNPHPDIAEAYMELTSKDYKEEQRLKHLEKLTQNNSEHYESLIVMAKVAIEEELWQKARNYLNKAFDLYSGKRIYKLFAEIEEKENIDFEKSHMYWKEAANAPEDTAWICNNCGNKLDKWQSICSYCKSFATIEWEKTARNIDAKVIEHQKFDGEEQPSTSQSA